LEKVSVSKIFYFYLLSLLLLLIIIFSDMRIPLMWRDNVHFTGKTGGMIVDFKL